MKEIIIHIGSGKTGTSSIQNALLHNKKLNDDKIFYPLMGFLKTNQFFRFAFCDYDSTVSTLKRRINSNEFNLYQQELKVDFLNQSEGSVIISSEYLFHSDFNEIKSIKDFLKSSGFDKIHIVLYVRDPADYYLSFAQQTLKTRDKIPKPLSFSYDFVQCIKNWLTISPDTFIIKEFSSVGLVGGDIIEDFKSTLNTLGFDVDLNSMSSVNETLSCESTILLQDYQKVALNSVDFLEHVHRSNINKLLYSNYNGTKPKLKKNLRALLYERFKEDVIYMKNNYSIFQNIDLSKSYDSAVYIDFKDLIDGYSVSIYNDIAKRFFNEI